MAPSTGHCLTILKVLLLMLAGVKAGSTTKSARSHKCEHQAEVLTENM